EKEKQSEEDQQDQEKRLSQQLVHRRPRPSVKREASSLGGFARAPAPWPAREASSTTLCQLPCLLLAPLQIKFSAAQDRQVADEEKVARSRHVDVWQAAFVQLLPELRDLQAVQGQVQDDDAFAPTLVGNSGHCQHALGALED